MKVCRAIVYRSVAEAKVRAVRVSHAIRIQCGAQTKSWRIRGVISEPSETRSNLNDLEARSTGLEPVTSGVTGRRSNQLN